MAAVRVCAFARACVDLSVCGRAMHLRSCGTSFVQGSIHGQLMMRGPRGSERVVRDVEGAEVTSLIGSPDKSVTPVANELPSVPRQVWSSNGCWGRGMLGRG